VTKPLILLGQSGLRDFINARETCDRQAVLEGKIMEKRIIYLEAKALFCCFFRGFVTPGALSATVAIYR
jgi:hypothetical protein